MFDGEFVGTEPDDSGKVADEPVPGATPVPVIVTLPFVIGNGTDERPDWEPGGADIPVLDILDVVPELA